MDNMVANDRAVDSMNNGVRMTERADPSTPPANTLHLYVKDSSGTSALFFIDDSGGIQQLTQGNITFVFPIAGTIVTGTSLTSLLVAPRALQLKTAYITAKTGPTGQALIADIKKNSSSIWNSHPANRIQIADGSTYGTQTSFDITTLAEGDILSADINQVGSGTPGADITIELKTL